MRNLLQDETGAITTAEMLIVITLILGVVAVGVTVVRDSMVQELGDVAEAAGALSNTYDITGVRKLDEGGNGMANCTGSAFIDNTDACDCDPLSFAPVAPKVDPSGSFILEGN